MTEPPSLTKVSVICDLSRNKRHDEQRRQPPQQDGDWKRAVLEHDFSWTAAATVFVDQIQVAKDRVDDNRYCHHHHGEWFEGQSFGGRGEKRVCNNGGGGDDRHHLIQHRERILVK